MVFLKSLSESEFIIAGSSNSSGINSSNNWLLCGFSSVISAFSKWLFPFKNASLKLLPFYEWKHCIVTPAQHPLLEHTDITLDILSGYPIIAYHDGISARSQINLVFEKVEITPNIVMSALDADVIKTYIETGLGISILSEKAFEATQDLNLRGIPTDLFGSYKVKIAIRKDYLLRDYGYSFITLCSKDIDIEALKQRIINF